MLFELLRPYRVMWTSFRYTSWLLSLLCFMLALTLYLSIWVTPSDFQQGENYRIIYVHVPAAWMSLLIYVLITVSSLLFLVTKHPVLLLCSRTGARIGALFTLLTLVTGSAWGKPMWGTFWVWDARLTSVLILWFIYLGALRFHEISAEIASLFICIGCINIPIIKFSVNWWNTLHQPSSISQFGTSIHISMLVPILLMFLCFVLVSLFLLFVEARQSILSAYSASLRKQVK